MREIREARYEGIELVGYVLHDCVCASVCMRCIACFFDRRRTLSALFRCDEIGLREGCAACVGDDYEDASRECMMLRLLKGREREKNFVMLMSFFS